MISFSSSIGKIDPEARRIATKAKLAKHMIDADRRRAYCKLNIYNTFSHSYIRYLYIENSSLYTTCVYISNFKYTVYVYLMYLIYDADIDIIFNFYTFKLIIIVQNKSG